MPLNPPEPGEAIRALNLVRAWLDGWSVDPQGRAPAVAQACLTLRLDGEVVGRAEVVATEQDQGRGVIEEAASAAMAQAEQRMVVPRDALWNDRMREQGRRIRVSLELGGLPVPVDVASFEEAALMVSPGVAGVGARAGAGETARVALVFPSAMVGAGLDVGAALASAANEALEDGSAALSGVGALQGRGVRFLAFECVWVAEVGEDATASILQRGGRVFETRDVATPMVRELGARLADLVSRQAARGETGSDGAEAERAAASFARALGAYALARWASSAGAGAPEQAEDWGARAAGMFARAGEGMDGASPGAAALWVMVGSELPPSGNAEGESAVTLARGRAGEALVRSLALHEQASAPVAAMLAWAAAWRGGSIGDPDLVDRADAALRAAYARTPAAEWVGLMPWAGWAEIEIAAARQRLAGRDGAIAGAAALREMRDLLWRHQVNASDVSAVDRDLVGGIVFTRGRQPLPTWHSLRPVAFAATMMGDPRLTAENEFPGQVLRMLTAVRFLRQLCADETVLTWADGAPWGVRAATWTDEQPEEATPMALLVLTEMVRSLEAVAERRAGAGAGG